ncbi:MAG: TRAP transporter small permease [Deltaproteobacteria bacterium]|nr:TRAP transporter small permease [Candidatus Anaeroferrophillacea bacterium]
MNRRLTWLAGHLEEVLGALLLALMACLAMANVIARYLVELPLAYTEELEVDAMVWLTFLGSAAAFRKRRHLRLLFFVDRLPAEARTVLERLTALAAAGLFLWLAELGRRQLVDERLLEITSESLGLPQWLYTIATPAGCLLVVLRIIESEWRTITNKTDEVVTKTSMKEGRT